MESNPIREKNISLAQNYYEYSTQRTYNTGANTGNVVVGKVKETGNEIYLTVDCGCIWAYTFTKLHSGNADFFASVGITNQKDIKKTAQVIIYSDACFPTNGHNRGVAIGYQQLELKSLQDIEWYPEVFIQYGFNFTKLITDHPAWNIER